MDNIGLMLLLQLVLIVLNAVFACAEIAVISINENKLEKMAEDGNINAIRLQKLKGQPARFLATIQVAITLSGFLGSAFAADNFSDPLVTWILSLGVSIPRSTLDAVSVVVITLILSYFTLILGELVPKRVAMRKTEQIGLALAAPVYWISKLFAPVVSFLTFSTNSILRLMKIDPDAADNDVSEEDIRMMVEAGNKTGAIDSEESEIIQNVFEFDDLTAGEIATHRTDMVALWMEESDEEWARNIREGDYLMFPVCGESVDDVVGVLNAMDYFKLEAHDRKTVMEKAVSPAYMVPETVKADVLFRNMKQTRNSFAVVMDEYGGVVGIVTMNDLIEEIVGDITVDEEEAAAPPEISKVTVDGEECWRISGSAALDEVQEALDITLPETECDTFGGYVFEVIGAVPNDGCQLELNTAGLNIRLSEIADHQLVYAIVRIVKKEKQKV